MSSLTHPPHSSEAALQQTYFDAYRRRRAGAPISGEHAQHLDSLTPRELANLEEMAGLHDEADREMRRAQRNGITVIDGGRILAPIVIRSPRPLARRRGAGRPRAQASRSSGRSGDSGDPDGESPGQADAAYYLRGFLVHLISFPWSEALIDSAYAFSLEIECEIATVAS